MGYTNSTPNLHLPQFVGSDKPTWLSDVNGAMLAIDTAYGTIEAEASSAATAASGAVTTANAASSAAEGAASAASTASTNASQALTTANNAATTANNAAAAVAALQPEVLASVTGDGVKTVATLFNELYGLVSDKVDGNNIDHITLVELATSGATIIYKPANITPTTITFQSGNGTAAFLSITTIILATTGSSVAGARMEAGGNTLTDYASNIAPAGTVYKIVLN